MVQHGGSWESMVELRCWHQIVKLAADVMWIIRVPSDTRATRAPARDQRLSARCHCAAAAQLLMVALMAIKSALRRT